MKKLLALLLLLMAAGQLVSYGRFVEIVAEYRFASLHNVLLGLELFGGIGLWFGGPKSFMTRWGSLAAFSAAILWSLLCFQAYARGFEIENVGLFGAFFPQYLGTGVLFQTIILVIWSYFVKKGAQKKRRGRS